MSGEPPLSPILDPVGIYYDAAQPSRLEEMLRDPLVFKDQALMARARAGLSYIRSHQLTKYNVASGALPADLENRRFVLVVDQTSGDASLVYGRASAASFAEMLKAAHDDNPGCRVVVKTHPDVVAGMKAGCLANLPDDVLVLSDEVSSWNLLGAAAAVYTATSLLGMEALMAGKRVHVFGMPFYAGWGLTQDRLQEPRRNRSVTLEELFAAAYLLYPTYYDPIADELTDFETVAGLLTFWRAENEKHWQPTFCLGMSLWKRRTVSAFLRSAAQEPISVKRAADAIAGAKAAGGRVVVWASKSNDALRSHCEQAGVPLLHMEDGFIRSKGLGSDLVQPSSLVLDQTGIYYDPSRISDLETLIAELEPTAEIVRRAAALRDSIVSRRLTKYNVGDRSLIPDIPTERRVILIPGQVANDASILKGAGKVASNWGLLQTARRANPDAFLIYKPHPDVEADNREGYIPPHRILHLADYIAAGLNSEAVIGQVDEVWTMTSLLGFEALLRGKSVTCLGKPFYAGWGVTTDHEPCERRGIQRSVDLILYAALVQYAAYTIRTGTGERVRAPIDRVLQSLA